MAPMPFYGSDRENHACGLVKDPERGPEVVIAGGTAVVFTDSVDIYSVDTDSWREGNTNQNNF